MIGFGGADRFLQTKELLVWCVGQERLFEQRERPVEPPRIGEGSHFTRNLSDRSRLLRRPKLLPRVRKQNSNPRRIRELTSSGLQALNGVRKLPARNEIPASGEGNVEQSAALGSGSLSSRPVQQPGDIA
jgi:hypothetical protein